MIELRDDIHSLDEIEGVRVWLPQEHLSDADRKELVFWRTSPSENPLSPFIDSLLVKALDLPDFNSKWSLIGLRPGMRCLELGAGQGWASAMLQKRVPDAEVHASDVSPDALRIAARWEAVFETRLAGRWAFPACDAPFADAQFDRIFLFAALHHMGKGNDFTATLSTVRRLLRPGGQAHALNEPASPPWLYARANRRFNQVRKEVQGADVDEDVLVLSRLHAQAAAAGLSMEVSRQFTPIYREPSLYGAVRSAVVRALPVLTRLLSGGVHLTFTRRR